MTLRIDLRLAWRLLRGAPGRTILLAVCLAIGVAARAFVGTIGDRAESAISAEARPMLGADVEVYANRPLTADEQARLAGGMPEHARTTTLCSLIAMARAGGPARLVDVRAVAPGWPLLSGEVLAERAPGIDDLATALAEHDGVPGCVVQRDVLSALGLALGDTVQLGQARCMVRGILAEGPGLTASLFSLGPRLVIAEQTLEATGLAGFGSRTRFSLLIALPDPAQADAVRQRLREALNGDREPDFSSGAPRVRVARDAQPTLNRVFDRLGDFLRLASLAALLIGGVGVAGLVSSWIRTRAEDIALLAVVGCPPGRAARILMLQVLVVALVATLVGALAGAFLAWGSLALLSGSLPVAVEPGWSLSAMGAAVAVGLLVAIAFTAAPLAAISGLTPLAVLRNEDADPRGGRLAWLLVLAATALITVIAALDAHSWRVGPGFVAVLIVSALVVRGLGSLVLRITSRLRLGPVGVRLATANLARPSLRHGTTLVGLALPVVLLAGLATWRTSLKAAFDPDVAGLLPGLFVIDLQVDQTGDFTRIIRDRTGSAPLGLSPVVMARLRKVDDGRPGAGRHPPEEPPKTREDEKSRFFLTREQRLSWRPEAGSDEVTLQGRWPVDPEPGSDHAEASLDAGFAADIGARIGDVLILDIQNVEVRATVVGLRDVRFTSFRPNFFILLNPGALRDAPQTWIAAVPDLGSEGNAAIRDAIVEAAPNATVIDIATMARLIRSVVIRVVAALRVVGGFALAAGLAVLAALAVAAARERRRDAAILRAVGAPDAVLVTALASEFLIIGLLAATLGITLGALGIAALLILVQLPPVIPLGELGLLAGSCGLLATIAGLLANRRALREPPLAVLRNE